MNGSASSSWQSRLRRVGVLLSGNIGYLATQAISLAVITRSTNGVEDAADFLLAQAVATPLALLVSGRVRDQFATGPLTSRFGPRMIRLGLLAVVVGVVVTLGWAAVADGQRQWVGIWVLWANLAQLPTVAAQGRCIRRGALVESSLANAMLGTLSMGSIYFGYRLGGLTEGAFLLAATWATLAALLTVRELALDRKVEHVPERPVTGWAAWRDDIGVGLAAMAMMAQPSAARVGVAAFAGTLALAQFGTVSQVARLGSFVMNATKSAASVELAEMKETGSFSEALAQQLRRLRLLTAGAMVLGAVGGGLLGPAAIGLVFSDAVRPDALTCTIMFGGSMALYGSMMLNQIGIAGENTRQLLVAGLAGLAVTVICIAPFASQWGAAGGAAAVTGGYLARFFTLDRMLVSIALRTRLAGA